MSISIISIFVSSGAKYDRFWIGYEMETSERKTGNESL